MSQTQWARTKIVQITEADLKPVSAHACLANTKVTIPKGFETEARSRHLTRKRQHRRNVLLSDSCSESDVPGNSASPRERISAGGAHASSTPTRDDKTTPLDPCDTILEPATLQSSVNVAVPQDKTVTHQKSMQARCERAARNEATTTIPEPPTLQSSVNAAAQQEETVTHAKSMAAICDRAGRNEATTTVPQPPTLQSWADVEVPQDETVAHDKSMPAICESAGTNQASTSTGITDQAEPSNIDADTPTQWTLNDRQYMRKVAYLLEFDLGKHLQKGHVHSFTERVCQAKLMRDFRDRNFWSKADPEIDAWMLATGRKRGVFDINAFVDREPDVLSHLARLRKKLNVMVLTSRCPVARALKAKENPGAEEEQEEVPSQTFWTTVKKWFH